MKNLILAVLLVCTIPAYAQKAAKPNLKLTATSATLNWSQSASAGVTGNNIYRSLVTGGPYTKIYSSPTPITTYMDSGLTPLTKYFYVVTAVCSQCAPAESPYSNEGFGTTQGLPQPSAPTNLVIAQNGATVNAVETLAGTTDSNCTTYGTAGPTEVLSLTASARVSQ